MNGEVAVVKSEEGDSVKIEVVKEEEEEEELLIEAKEAAKNAKIVAVSLKIIKASNWDGDSDKKMCVLSCLTSLLSVKECEDTKKRKLPNR
jgi:hypothetical protein